MNKLEDLANLQDQMLFGIYSRIPNSAVMPFLEMFFPRYANKSDSPGYIITAPDKTLQPEKSIHTWVFYNHPLGNWNFREGQLRLFAAHAPGYSPRISEGQLHLYFDKIETAESAFEEIYSRFEPICYESRISDKADKKIAVFSASQLSENGYQIVLILNKDENTQSYKLLFGTNSLLNIV